MDLAYTVHVHGLKRLAMPMIFQHLKVYETIANKGNPFHHKVKVVVSLKPLLVHMDRFRRGKIPLLARTESCFHRRLPSWHI